MSPLESAGWSPSRVDYRAAKRTQWRCSAILFNLFFLVLITSPFPGVTVFFGTVCVVLVVTLTLHWFAGVFLKNRTIRDQMGKLLVAAGKTPGAYVEVRIFREGVEIGRDVGRISRSRGGLTFEGERSRFGIVRDDMAVPPEAKSTLSSIEVNTPDGVVKLLFSPQGWQPDDFASFLQEFKGWPDSVCDLPGPPTTVQPRSSLWYWHVVLDQALGKDGPHRLLFPVIIAIHLLSRILSDPVIIGLCACLVVGFIARAAVLYRAIVAQDEKDLARLAAIDAAQNVVIEASTTGTGNPEVRAAVG